jgi:hypothetical protein
LRPDDPGDHQGKRTMDKYVDLFKDLIDLAGYTEGVAIVMKFRRRLRHDIQDQIVQLANGRPADNNIHAWYNAADRTGVGLVM